MARLRDVAGNTGLFTDGDWILSENMDVRGTVGVIQLKHVGVGEFLRKDFQFISTQTFEKLKCTEVFPGDVLISRMADPIGRACIVPRLPFRAVTVVDVSIVRVDPLVADAPYVAHLCNSPLVRRQIEPSERGTTRARITRTELEDLDVPLPLPEEQRRLSMLLDNAEGVRRAQRFAVDLASTFERSAFLKMCVTDAGSFDRVPVSELAAPGDGSIRTGPFGSQLLHSEFTAEGVAVLGIDNAVNNRFEWAERRFITSAKYEQFRRYTVFAGDVLMTIMGTCGRCAIVPTNIQRAINTKHLCCITLNQARCLPGYFRGAFLYHPLVRRDLGVAQQGAIMDGLNMQIIKNLRIPVASRPIQERYVALTQEHARQEALLREGARQADHLFECLLQRTFKSQPRTSTS